MTPSWSALLPIYRLIYEHCFVHWDSRKERYLPFVLARHVLGGRSSFQVEPKHLSWSLISTGNSHFVWKGDWDQTLRPFEQDPRHIAMLDLLTGTEPDDFHRSKFYQKAVAAFRQDRPLRVNDVTLDSFPKIERFCESRIGLYLSMKQWGYRSQAELQEHERRPFGASSKGEINVAIGRGGRLIKCSGGGHRLAIAKILGLDWVIVRARFVHHEWAIECLRDYGGPLLGAIGQGLVHTARQYAPQPNGKALGEVS